MPRALAATFGTQGRLRSQTSDCGEIKSREESQKRKSEKRREEKRREEKSKSETVRRKKMQVRKVGKWQK